MIAGARIPQIPGVEPLRLLSSGGMGDVLLARKRGPHGFEKLVAVKLIRPELAILEGVRAMFVDEARLLSRASHPAVTQVLDFGEREGVLYLVMEYVAGVPFARLLERGPLEPGVAARLMAEVARGLHAAHELPGADGRPLGVVHRDVSPENLVLSFEGAVKILDFGIALTRDRLAPATELGQVRGKPAYLAPEQILGQRVDRRADVYAACAVLYELLIGRRRFAGGSIQRMVEGAFEVPAAPSALGVPVPPALEELVLRGLAVAAAERFPTARALSEALDEVAGALGAERLEPFAERALAEERAAHELRLRGPAAPGLLAQERRTEPDLPVPGDREPAHTAAEAEPAAPALDPGAGPPPQVSQGEREGPSLPGPAAPRAERAASGRAGTPRPWPAGLLILALGTGLLVWWWAAPSPEPALQGSPAEPVTRGDTSSAATLPARAADEPRRPAGAPTRADPPARPPPARAASGRPRRAPEAAPAPAPDPLAQPARLTLDARPYVLVFLDDREIGASPVVDLELAPGPHRLRCLEPDTGRVRHEEVLHLAPGQRRTISVR